MPKLVVPKNVDPGDDYNKSSKQIRFVEGITMGMTPSEAVDYAGYSDKGRALRQMEQDPWVKEQVSKVRAKNEEEMAISRSKVQEIVTDAVEMARMQAVPSDMIRGAAELNKMCGYYAPEEKVLSIQHSEINEELVTMSEEDLLALAGKERDSIEAEFEVLDKLSDENA